MAKAKGRTRQDRRLKDMGAPPPPRYVPTRFGMREESREFDVLEYRVFIAMWFDERGKLTDFCSELKIESRGQWIPMLRVDCAHGEAHFHRFDAAGREDRRVIREIVVQDDVQIAHGRADEMIYDVDVARMLWERGVEG
jgi:hypothetical protein